MKNPVVAIILLGVVMVVTGSLICIQGTIRNIQIGEARFFVGGLVAVMGFGFTVIGLIRLFRDRRD